MTREQIIRKYLEELNEVLTWEGIIGYEDLIIDVLTKGKKSYYYEKMIEEKEDIE